MPRLPPITAKDQVPAKDHAVFDSIVASRGAVQGPFTMFLHAPEVSERVAHLGKVRLTAGGAKLLDVREVNDALVQAGSATIKGAITTKVDYASVK